MKKLNKKGFTLVELLAVIVILAVVMVITIPTVLGSMGEANKSAFESAVKAVQKYIDDQTEICKAGLGNTIAPYEASIFKTVGNDKCVIDSEKSTTIIEKAGYKDQMTISSFDGNKIKTASGANKFAGQSYGTAS